MTPAALRAPRGWIKEADVLKNALDYLAAEKIWRVRITPGKHRVSGTPVKVNQEAAGILAAKFPDLKEWDGTIRVKEKWIDGFPKGTPDIFGMLPANRQALDEATQEYVTCNYARPLWIETKIPKGGKISLDQKNFRSMCLEIGALHYLVKSPEELRRFMPPRSEINFWG